jgi:hypothetical protein
MQLQTYRYLEQNNIIQMFDLLIDNSFVQLIYWSTTPLSSLLDMCFNKQLVFQCVRIVLSYSLVKHPLCYSYIQSSLVKILAVTAEERKNLRKKYKIHVHCHFRYGYFIKVNQWVAEHNSDTFHVTHLVKMYWTPLYANKHK